MTVEPSLQDDLLAAVPKLRAFALSLTRTMDRVDDLVQETLLRAWVNRQQFQQDTNLDGWLFTILRNVLYVEHRKRKREVSDDGFYAAQLTTLPNQEAHLDYQDFLQALVRLPASYQEVLLLVGAEGLTYEQAAEVCGVAVGTIKSRVNRARERLSYLLSAEASDLGPDRLFQAAMQPAEISGRALR